MKLPKSGLRHIFIPRPFIFPTRLKAAKQFTKKFDKGIYIIIFLFAKTLNMFLFIDPNFSETQLTRRDCVRYCVFVTNLII